MTARIAVLGAALAAGSAGSAARAQLFDFEELAEGNFPSVTSTQGGLSVTVTPAGPGNFDVGPVIGAPIFGNRSLVNFFGNRGRGTDLIFDFSRLLSSVSIQAGDFATDSNIFTLTAFSGANATGAVLGLVSVPYAASASIGNGVAATLSLSVPGIQSIRLNTAGEFGPVGAVSAAYDNLQAVVQAAPGGGGVIPEPGTLALAATVLLPLAGAVVRKRRKA
jgi:hypothetical protein